MRGNRDRFKGLCLLAGLAWTAATWTQAAGQCQSFSDPAAFEAYNEKVGLQLLGAEDFEPPVSNLGFGDIALLVDPLEAGVENIDPETGLGFPEGLASGMVIIQSSVTPRNPAVGEPGNGLAAVGPGAVDPPLPAPESVKVGADYFSEGTDLFFSSDAGWLWSVGLTLEVAFGGSAEVTVFSWDEYEIFSQIVEAPEGEAVFLGVSCVETPITRINVSGSGGELVDDIQMWGMPTIDCPWDCGDGDGEVGIVDFLALLSEWGAVGTPCDIGLGEPGVGVEEFLALLGAWGPCPGER
jgi:hypothetical protein